MCNRGSQYENRNMTAASAEEEEVAYGAELVGVVSAVAAVCMGFWWAAFNFVLPVVLKILG